MVQDESPLSALLALDALLLAIRKDIGHSNKQLESGSILKTFVNDFKEI